MEESKVEYGFLGKSGLKVSNIALGTMTFGKTEKTLCGKIPTQATEDTSYKLLDRFAELGGNFIDTSNSYGNAEEILGNWLSKNERDKFVVATKVRFSSDTTNVNAVGLSRRCIIDACEKSLEKLQTHFIDLYMAHMWDSATPIEETLRTFDDLIRCGKIRYFGVSNVCGWQLQKIVDRTESMCLNSCISLQQQYNLLVRQSEFEEFNVCRNEGIGVLTWSPLKGGILTGKFERNTVPSESKSRVGYITSKEWLACQGAPSWNSYANDEKFWQLMTTLESIAKKHGKTIPQVAIRWLLQQDIVTSVVVGATSVDQLEENIGAAKGWELSPQEDIVTSVVVGSTSVDQLEDNIGAAKGWELSHQEDIVSSVVVGSTSVDQLEDNIGAAKGWELSPQEMKELTDHSPRSYYYPYEMIYRINNDRHNPFNN